jgi:superfamily II DNA or RNA helicase
MNILSLLTDDAIREHFDPLTVHRALEYASTGCVSTPHIDSLTRDQVSATAEVQGTRSWPYVVQLHAEGDKGGVWVTSECTCPVAIDCKHGAALALVLGSAFARHQPEPPAWQHRLRELIADLDQSTTPTGELPPLALEFSLDHRSGHRAYYRSDLVGHTVRIRPMRLGARGKWVKTGADWRDLSGAALRRAHPPAQLESLLDLHGALQTNGFWPSGLPASLADFGPRVLSLIGRAAAAGVALTTTSPLAGVELVEDPVALATDVTREPDGHTRLRVGVERGGRLWTGDDVVTLGNPAHGVGLLDGDRLLLAATARPWPASVLRLVSDGAPLDVPASSADTLADYLAPLNRLVTVRSSDGSVPLPAPVRPVLRLTVTWRSSTEASLRWDWCYDRQECAIGSADRLGGLRDPAAEQAILATLPDGLSRRGEAHGGDALALAIHELPALRDLDDVEVVEVERPDFRESDDDPEIGFEVTGETVDAGTDWLDLEVTISVEGERVPLAFVLAALTLGDDYVVLPSGLYFRTDRPEFDNLREVVAAASQLREVDGDRMSVGTHDLGVWAQLAELGVVDAQASEWVARAQALRDLVDLPRPEPTGLATTLRAYQRDGFHWLAFLWQHGLGGILADDMGLGKTLQVLALIQHAVASGGSGGSAPFLVVAPTSVVSAWQGEAARHAPGLRVRTIARRSDDVAAAAADADVVVTTYALMRLGQEEFAALPWGGLILDEAQQVKNHRGKTYAAARRIDAPFRLAVTGTPFENRLMELWALLSIAAPGLYPWPKAFTEHVVNPVEKGRDQAALRRFQGRIRPFILRRTKELVAADLPPKQEQVLEVELAPRHRKIYDTHLAKERQRILGLVEDFEHNRVAIFSALTKLRQLALDPALIDPAHDRVGSAKLDLLVDQLAEITAEGHRALVFSQFTSFLRRVEARLGAAGLATTYLDGTTKDRGEVIDRFRSGCAPIFLISLKAGGVGLTLTEADYVFVLDPWWNPATEAQAVDRAHRIGQTQHVMVYRLIAEDTIEQKVMELKGRKAELFARVVDGDGAMAAGIEAADIRALFDE